MRLPRRRVLSPPINLAHLNVHGIYVLKALPALLLACFMGFGCWDHPALVRIYLRNDTLLTKDLIILTVSDGRSRWIFGPSAFHPNPGRWSLPELETQKEGTLRVSWRFKSPEGAVLSDGELSLGLRKDWRWEMEILRDDTNPLRGCFGCFGYKAFPILDPAYMTSDSDSVFVIWGGNSISHPVTY